MSVWNLTDLIVDTRRSGANFKDFLRVESMSCGMYILPGGGVDDQTPHREDEIYVIVRGSGQILIDDTSHPVEPGSVIFVPANVEHRFHSYEEDLEILVVFAPAYSGRASAGA